MSLETHHQPRTLRIAGNPDEPQRISRADEDLITQQSRRAGIADDLERHELELRAELRKLRDPEIRPSRQTYRDLGNAIVLIGKVRAKLSASVS